jgi:hypothetical protein
MAPHRYDSHPLASRCPRAYNASVTIRAALAGVLLALALSACGGKDGNSTVNSAALLSIDAQQGALSSHGAHYSLRLGGTSSVAVVFSDRPLRHAKLIPLEEIVRE